MKDPRFPKLVVFVNALVPLAMLGWDAFQGQLGVNPIKSAIHISGMLAIIFLLLSLCVTPLRMISGRNWLSHFRRMLGLFAFFYGMVHLGIYFVFDRELDVFSIFSEVVKHPFILFGMTALLLMVPLAITSTNDMIKRLGAKKWKRLHQLVYISAIAALIHFWMSSKLVTNPEIAVTIALTVLLGYRVLRASTSYLKRKPQVPVSA